MLLRMNSETSVFQPGLHAQKSVELEYPWTLQRLPSSEEWDPRHASDIQSLNSVVYEREHYVRRTKLSEFLNIYLRRLTFGKYFQLTATQMIWFENIHYTFLESVEKIDNELWCLNVKATEVWIHHQAIEENLNSCLVRNHCIMMYYFWLWFKISWAHMLYSKHRYLTLFTPIMFFRREEVHKHAWLTTLPEARFDTN